LLFAAPPHIPLLFQSLSQSHARTLPLLRDDHPFRLASLLLQSILLDRTAGLLELEPKTIDRLPRFFSFLLHELGLTNKL
jgi:hypothetical protein